MCSRRKAAGDDGSSFASCIACQPCFTRTLHCKETIVRLLAAQQPSAQATAAGSQLQSLNRHLKVAKGPAASAPKCAQALARVLAGSDQQCRGLLNAAHRDMIGAWLVAAAIVYVLNRARHAGVNQAMCVARWASGSALRQASRFAHPRLACSRAPLPRSDDFEAGGNDDERLQEMAREAEARARSHLARGHNLCVRTQKRKAAEADDSAKRVAAFESMVQDCEKRINQLKCVC